jgi:DNA replication and repair protein RecF
MPGGTFYCMMYFLTMFISSLQCDNFRNYNSLSIDLPREGALFVGANGSGKTNLLEAIFLLCTARSQRGSRRSDCIRFGSECHAEGTFAGEENAPATAVSIGFSRQGRVSMKINGKTISSFSQWIGHGLVVSFGPDDLSIVQGLPADRRNFLDLVISQIDPVYLESLICYRRNLAQRNNLLARRIDDAQLDAFEEEMVRYGAVVFTKRKEVLDVMAPSFVDFYGEISGKKEAGSLEYRPSIRCDSTTQNDWKNVFFNELKKARNRDIQNGFSSVGPHRDDIAFFVNGTNARAFASLGQCTTVSLAARMSSVLVSRRYRNDTMIFLFDDAVSYLDAMRTSRVFPLLSNRGQLLITAPSEREPDITGIARFRIHEGTVEHL